MRLIRKLITTIKKGFYKLMDKIVEAVNKETASQIAKWTFIKDSIASVWRTFKSSYMLKIMTSLVIGGASLALSGASLALGGASLIEAKEAHAELKREREREKELAELDHRIAVQEKIAVLNKEATTCV